MDNIKKAINKYNKYRYPEAKSSIIKKDNDLYYIKFEGSFCETCGLYDWIDDLKYVMAEFGISAEIINVEDDESSNYRIAIFKIKEK